MPLPAVLLFVYCAHVHFLRQCTYTVSNVWLSPPQPLHGKLAAASEDLAGHRDKGGDARSKSASGKWWKGTGGSLKLHAALGAGGE